MNASALPVPACQAAPHRRASAVATAARWDFGWRDDCAPSRASWHSRERVLASGGADLCELMQRPIDVLDPHGARGAAGFARDAVDSGETRLAQEATNF